MLRLALASALAALPLLASAMAIDDLRVGYAPLAGREFEVIGTLDLHEPKTTGATYHDQVKVSHDAKRHQRWSVIYRRSVGELQAGFGAPLWGLELASDHIEESQDETHYSGHSEMLDVFAGWAWRVMPRWHIEQGVLFGAGHARWRQNFERFYIDDATWDDTASGFAYEYGFAIGSYYTFGDRLDVGLDVRHLVTKTRVRFIGSHDTDPSPAVDATQSVSFDGKFDVRGFGLTLSAGYRF